MNEFKLPYGHTLHHKTILAIDFGEKFIGLATFCINRDPFPVPYGRMANMGESFIIQELKTIIENECIELIVIGLPFLTDGKATSSTSRAKSFVNLIREHFTLPVHEQDETLSTFEAQSRMKSSPQYNFQVDLKQIDAVAATVILEDFIRRTKAVSQL